MGALWWRDVVRRDASAVPLGSVHWWLTGERQSQRLPRKAGRTHAGSRRLFEAGLFGHLRHGSRALKRDRAGVEAPRRVRAVADGGALGVWAGRLAQVQLCTSSSIEQCSSVY